jgi:hypothetical protein
MELDYWIEIKSFALALPLRGHFLKNIDTYQNVSKDKHLTCGATGRFF